MSSSTSSTSLAAHPRLCASLVFSFRVAVLCEKFCSRNTCSFTNERAALRPHSPRGLTSGCAADADAFEGLDNLALADFTLSTDLGSDPAAAAAAADDDDAGGAGLTGPEAAAGVVVAQEQSQEEPNGKKSKGKKEKKEKEKKEKKGKGKKDKAGSPEKDSGGGGGGAAAPAPGDAPAAASEALELDLGELDDLVIGANEV